MADESQAINIARNHATDTGRVVSIGFMPNGEVHCAVGVASNHYLGETTGRDALDVVTRAITAADSFAHARDNAKIRIGRDVDVPGIVDERGTPIDPAKLEGVDDIRRGFGGPIDGEGAE